MRITFAELLRDYRLKRSLTQQSLSDSVGLTRGYIASLEQGVRRNPSPAVLSKLAESLSLSDSEKQEFFLSVQGTALSQQMKTRWGSPVLEAMAEFLALPHRSPQAPQQLKEVFRRLIAVLRERGVPEQHRKEAHWLSMLTVGYTYTPPGTGAGVGKKVGSKRKPLPRTLDDESRMAYRLISLLEIFIDGRIHIASRARLAKELLEFAKWRTQSELASAHSPKRQRKNDKN